MTERLVFIALSVALILGSFAWRTWRDRLTSRSLATQAEIGRALRHVLGGDSLFAFEVVSSVWWRRGQVVLLPPAGGPALLETALSTILSRTPMGYDVVIRGVAKGPDPSRLPSEEKSPWLPRRPGSLRPTSSTSPITPSRRTRS